MLPRIGRFRSAFNFSGSWKLWTAAVTSSLTLHSTFAVCEGPNPSESNATSSNTSITSNTSNINDVSSQDTSSSVSPATMVGWGMRFGSHPKSIDFFANTKVKSLKFSAILQSALDQEGRVYFRYDKSDWKLCNTSVRFRDVSLSDNTLYLLSDDGRRLFEYQINPYVSSEDAQHLSTNFSPMPQTANFDSNLDYPAQNEIIFANTHDFVENLTRSLNNPNNSTNNDSDTSPNLLKLRQFSSETFDKVISCENRLFLLTTSGDVYVRGNNTRGACGIGFFDESSMFLSDFTKIPRRYFDSRVTEIAGGKDHTLFVTETGRLFSCGADNLLQLGLGWTKAKCIQADGNWTVLGRDGFNAHARVFNDLDIDKQEFYFELPPTDEFYPRVVTGPYFDNYKVVSCACGDYHSAVVVEPLDYTNPLARERPVRKVHTMHSDPHWNEMDQMNEMKEKNENENENKSDGEELQGIVVNRGGELRVVEALGPEVGRHTLDLSDLRRVVTFGCGLKGQLGTSNYKNASEPRPIKDLEDYREYSESLKEYVRIKPVSVACGKEHTVVLMEGKNKAESGAMVFAFGSNQHRQVTRKKQTKVPKATWIEDILPTKFDVSNVSAGHYQSAAFA